MTRRFIFISLLLGLGLVLNLVSQGFSLQGMKVDFVIVMLCISILISKTYIEALTAGITFGILTALTSTFPAGEIANVVDKLLVALVMYTLTLRFNFNLKKSISMILFASLSTLLSGAVFLLIALSINNAFNTFGLLFITIVVPSTIGNAALLVLLGKFINPKKFA